jgi:hypothetical protein
MFQTKVVQKTKTHILCPITFFPKNRAVCHVEKLGTNIQVRSDSVI